MILILLVGCKNNKTEPLNESQTEITNYLFQDYIGEKPSASFIVIKDGEIKTCQSFGFADLDKGIKANCNTNYRIASVTKQFTAMAIMKLISQGKLTYETKISELFPDFPEYGNEITVKELLNHRSGLIEYFKLYPKDSKNQIVDKDVFELLKQQDSTIFKPNKKYKYSNSGYVVLSQIVEKNSGMSFKDFMDKEIFEPLQMNNSTVYLKDLEIKNRAYGYKFNDTIYELKDQYGWSAVQGDGGIYSSVNDYYKWDQALYTDDLITQKELKPAFSNWDENGMNDKDGYGFGWSILTKNETKYYLHSGGSTGFKTFSLRIPSKNISVAILTNNDDFGNQLKRKAFFLASYFSDGKIQIPADVLLEKEIEENGIDNIATKFNELKSNSSEYDIVEKDLVSLGFNYFSKKEDEKALKIFELIKTEFPQYFGGYFGLARYYKANDEKQKAIANFKKVTELATSEDQGLINYSKKMIKQLSE